ncbi:MAG: biotin--[acetyl-CoA-carboxylase] ligase [Planctomycetota bacterium]
MTWRRFHHDIVDSTNERAFEAIDRGDARHGDLFIAGSQTAGRGTHGRTWESAAGGLYLSAVLESDEVPAPGAWTIAGALAVHDVAITHGVEAQIDWPNDLVTPGGHKIAGVMAESRGLRANGPAVFVLGIGLNVDAAALPPHLHASRRVSSLSELSSGLALDEVEDTLARALEERVQEVSRAPETVYGAFFERCALAHRPVAVSGAQTGVEGTWTGLDPSLGLRIEGTDGTTRFVSVAHARGVRPLDRGFGRR